MKGNGRNRTKAWLSDTPVEGAGGRGCVSFLFIMLRKAGEMVNSGSGAVVGLVPVRCCC